MIDRDLADLYGVETKYLNRQVERNRERFPPEFMIQLTNSERNELVTNWHRFDVQVIIEKLNKEVTLIATQR